MDLTDHMAPSPQHLVRGPGRDAVESHQITSSGELRITNAGVVAGSAQFAKITGGRTNYYLVRIEHPQREDQPAYTAECEDIIEALELNPDEANIFKEIWRSANARKANGKPGHTALYGAEKIVHYAGRILRRLKRQAG